MDAVERQVREFIVENFMFGDEVEFSSSDSFLDTGLIDSTGILELIAFLEESYGIEVLDDEIIPENLDTLNNVASFVRSKKRQGSGPSVPIGDASNP